MTENESARLAKLQQLAAAGQALASFISAGISPEHWLYNEITTLCLELYPVGACTALHSNTHWFVNGRCMRCGTIETPRNKVNG